MENIEIPLTGITKTPSGKTNTHGDLDDCINLENYHGELRPIYPPKLVSGREEKLLCVHRRDGYDHRIYQGIGKINIHKTDSNGDEGDAIPITIPGSIKKIETVGNTLIVVSDEIYYILYKNGEYILLGSKIPFPRIEPTVTLTEENILKYPSVSTPGEFDKDAMMKALLDCRSGDVEKSEAGFRALKTIVTTGLIKSIAKNAEDGLFTFPFFVRYALRMYDGTLIKHSPPFLMVPSPYTELGGKFEMGRMSYNAVGTNPTFITPISHEIVVAKLFYKIFPELTLTSWSDIIESVDIFISNQQYTVDVNGNVHTGSNSTIIAGQNNPYLVEFPKIDRDAILAALSSESNFYLLESIPLSLFATSSQTLPAKVPASLLQTIVNRERMTDDYKSHDTLMCENVNTYNARISLSGVKRKVYPGYYGSAWTRIGGKDLQTTTGYSNPRGPFLFHPDRRAESIKIAGTNNNSVNVLLKPHTTLNGAYYIDPYLGSVQQAGAVTLPTVAQTLIDDLSDQLYTSEVNNPFSFRPSGIITFQGRVIGVATTTEPLSQGQYGQFPLYAFTDKGVWALEVSPTGSFSSKQAITREVCLSSDSITQLKREIAFLTEKGLCILKGNETEVITSVLEDNMYATPKGIDLTQLTAVADVPDILVHINAEPSFGSYMLNAGTAYDPTNDRIYLYNPNYGYSYIFSINSRTWTKVDQRISGTVANYPRIYFNQQGGVYEPTLDIPEDPETHIKDTKNVFFITRPIKMAEANYLIKELRMIATIDKVSNNVLTLYGSRDGVNYANIGSTFSERIRIKGTGYKYFKIAYAGKLSHTDKISGFIAKIQLKYTNHLR